VSRIAVRAFRGKSPGLPRRMSGKPLVVGEVPRIWGNTGIACDRVRGRTEQAAVRASIKRATSQKRWGILPSHSRIVRGRRGLCDGVVY